MLPNVVYAGMGKAGSTLLYKLFLRHPDIHVSALDKEINFFSSESNWGKGVSWYEGRFPGYQGEPWVIDISPGYHNKLIAVSRMKALLGQDLKVIFTFRRFTEFAFSRYLHRIRGKRARGGFLEMLEKRRMFYKPLDVLVGEYIKTFGRDNVLIMHYENEFDKSLPSFEQRIYEFLGLPVTDRFYAGSVDRKVNSGYYPRFVYSDDGPYNEEIDGVAYRVPANTLVYCSGRPYRNIFWGHGAHFKPSDAFELQRTWTTCLDEDGYDYVQKTYTEPLAHRLENSLGMSFEHWYVDGTQRIEYLPAPLPDAYINDPVLRAERLNINKTQTPWS